MQRTAADGFTRADSSSEMGGIFLQAVIGMKPEDTTSQVTARREIVILPMGWQEKEVEKLSSQQRKHFDPGGRWGHAPQAKQLLYCYLLSGGGGADFACFSFCLFAVFCFLSDFSGKKILLRRDENFHGRREQKSCASPIDEEHYKAASC